MYSVHDFVYVEIFYANLMVIYIYVCTYLRVCTYLYIKFKYLQIYPDTHFKIDLVTKQFCFN